MIYTDQENLLWWKGLSEGEQHDLFELMESKATSPGFVDFVQSVRDRWDAGVTLSAKELAAIRKWDR